MGKLATMLQVGRTFGVRDGMLRLEYELQRGSGLMSWRMRTVQGWESWRLDRIAPGVQAENMLSARQDGRRRFLFSDARSVGRGIRDMVGCQGEKDIRAQAEQILAGRLTFFGQLPVAGKFPPQWFQNAVTGQKVSQEQPWTQMRFASPAYGDLKFILEPSRFLFVYPLVRAYALSGDERFAAAFWSALEDWASQSPPMTGPLWICGQECSLRILAWSFALHAFISSPSTTSERVALLASMIAAHAWRTAQTIGYARSQRSNHLISEAVGLWTAGTLYPELREAPVWQNLGAHLLREAVLDQITTEGVSQQHSFNYQRMILHLLLWTLRLAEIHQVPLDEEIHARTELAFDFVRPWVDAESGLAPNYGSDDGSLILPLASTSYHDFRPLVQLGAAVLNRPALPSGPWDEAAQWLGVKAAVEGKTQQIPSSPSAETGYFRLGDSKSWALIRAGRYTRRPFQADQLHVDLWWQGVNLARDAGTYLYNGAPPWNNGFAGSAVHNTVAVDGRDQMRRASRFLWLDWARASGRVYSSHSNANVDCFEGEHDGYRNLGITHRRKVEWLEGVGWVIVDDILGTGVHEARLHWLTADLPCEVSDSPFCVTFTSAESKVRWSIFASVPGDTAVVRAGKQVWRGKRPMSEMENGALMGWEAPTYGELRPAVSLVYQTRSQLPVRFVTAIVTDETCKLESDEERLVISRFESGKESEVYRLNLSDKTPDDFKEQEFIVGGPRA
jgi:hypothetical protein